MKNENTSNQKFAEEFTNNTKDFYHENFSLIDKKHDEIIKSFYSEVNKNQNYFNDNLRNWSMQTDYSCPPQINELQLKKLGFLKMVKFYLKKKIQNLFDNEHDRAFFDDIEILKKNCNINLLRNHPVCSTPGYDNFYKTEENIITNYFFLGKIQLFIKYKIW